MSPALYQRMIEQCQPKLEVIFENVIIPRDAPNKQDHGDVDFLVGGIRVFLRGEELWKLVEGALAAEHRTARGESQSYAIPHPDIPDAYIQVDVELAPGDGTLGADDFFEWTKFMKGDADLLQIVGILHRPLGLFCNDRGLHVRVEEIEPYDKKRALIFLTRETDQALAFYGFDVHKYKQGFQNETEIFDWVAAGRFFSPDIFEQRVEKSDDRSRMRKRPMYQRFVNEYMPKQPKIVNGSWTRHTVLFEALKQFDVQDEYDRKMQEFQAEHAEEMLWKEIKDVLPISAGARKSVVKALKHWVDFDNDRPVISDRPIPTPHRPWSQSVNESNVIQVLSWIQRNWQEVKRRSCAYEESHR